MLNYLILFKLSLVFCVVLHFKTISAEFADSASVNHHLRQALYLSDGEDVPQYQVVRVRSLKKRSVDTDDTNNRGHHVNIRAFNSIVDLDLQPNLELDEHVRMFFADGEREGRGSKPLLHRIPGDTQMSVGQLFQDRRNDAAVLVDSSSSIGLQLSGVVRDLVLLPVPATLHNHALSRVSTDAVESEHDMIFSNETSSVRSRRSVGPEVGGLHFVYKRTVRDNWPHSIGGLDVATVMHSSDSGSHNTSILSRRRREVNDLYPQVLIILDFETYAVHGFSARQVKLYILSFLNAIDLRYRTLDSPSIRMKLAGIIIGKNRKATPFLDRNMVTGNQVDAINALASTGKYLFRAKDLPAYDAALVLTKRDMCTRKNRWSSCDRVTAGYAYVGGGCSVSKYYKQVNSVALVEDSGGFSGIIVATHELGHLLGAVHDGSRATQFIGGPGAVECPWSDGYIMSDLRHDEKGLQWSSCSRDQFRYFASSDRSHCMQNYPSSPFRSRRLETLPLPGTVMSLDAQCQKESGAGACFHDHRVCSELYCFERSTGYCVSYRPAAEGSSCGPGMHCIDGRCQRKSYPY